LSPVAVVVARTVLVAAVERVGSLIVHHLRSRPRRLRFRLVLVEWAALLAQPALPLLEGMAPTLCSDL
jgi:hypothetical protein